MLKTAGLKYPSSQFQTGLDQNQVSELLVAVLQQYSSLISIQVSQPGVLIYKRYSLASDIHVCWFSLTRCCL